MMESDIKLNEQEHSYTIDGQPVKSVTQLLKEYNLTPQYFMWKNRNYQAARRGQFVHKAIELFLKDNLDEDSLGPVIMPYFESFKKFNEKYELQPMEIELLVGGLVFGVAGKLDYWGRMKDRESSGILDWKSKEKITPADLVQAEFYRKLLNYIYESEVAEWAAIVRLDKNGKIAELVEPKGNERGVVEAIIKIEIFKSWGKK